MQNTVYEKKSSLFMSLLCTITSKYIESTLYDETKRHYEKSVLSVFNIGKKKKKTR